MPRVLLFPGSRRKDSYNRLLADYLGNLLSSHLEADLLAPEDVHLPLFDQDLEADPDVVQHASSLFDRFEQASGIIVASPEYNHHVAPYLKNTIDWVSRVPRIRADRPGNAFEHKPVLLACASTGWSGGVMGLHSARTLFSYLGGLVMPEQIALHDVESLLVDASSLAFDNSFAFSTDFEAYIRRTVERFSELVAHRSQTASHLRKETIA